MRIEADDLTRPEVIALLQEHLTNMYELSPPESVHALDVSGLRSPDITFWTVWDEGILLGCGALKELSRSHGEIKSMRTPKTLRRKGAARAILTHIIGVARERAYRRLSLETGSGDAFVPAQKLYESFGFSYCSPFCGYTDDPNSVFMSLELDSVATVAAALAFVETYGVVLASAKGPISRLVELIAGEPIRGNWWSHPKSSAIYNVLAEVSESEDILVCRLVSAKITLVHRKLWPALVRLADRFSPRQIARVRGEHTASGRHVVSEIPFPKWVPVDVALQAEALTDDQASALIGPIVIPESKRSRFMDRSPKARRSRGGMTPRRRSSG